MAQGSAGMELAEAQTHPTTAAVTAFVGV